MQVKEWLKCYFLNLMKNAKQVIKTGAASIKDKQELLYPKLNISINSNLLVFFGLESIIGFGNTTVEKALKNKAMKMCADLGSEMVVLSESQGFNNVLYANLNRLAEKRPMFKVLFGYAAQRYRSSIIGRIAEQIENVDCSFCAKKTAGMSAQS